MDSKFSVYTQNVTFLDRSGRIVNASMTDVDMFIQYNTRACINYGSQLGASIALLVILLLLTHSDKRSSAVFVLNALALFFNIARLLFRVIHFATAFEKFYPYFAYDYADVPTSAYAISVLAVIFETMLVICVQVSLVLQVQVVCSTLRRRYRRALLCLSIVVALVPIGFRTGWMVENSMHIISLDNMEEIWWLESSINIVITISICFFCVVFLAKLGYAIRQRHRLGLREFGPMKVIFVMGCQTLIAPAILSILQYLIVVPELMSNVLTLVVISLPLSSIWAGAALESSRRTTTPIHQRRNLWRNLAGGVSNGTAPAKPVGSDMSASTAAQTLCYSEQSANKNSEPDPHHGISIEHDISIQTLRRNQSPV
ncbi:Fungal pheromone mating factor STE2 GPCR [Penicillium alfredii]|uniref:Fungal pheromone mating factor STE2 GPCR n=1 Tax=Penicillium alfredii TaxID=1506179 RepID=A0A9W9FTB0_9EURO|nr:Fungal pheromone mating factor STE2 GPCR [Penicillium alfredii]KAJ5106071.1 Fungal pheromone mating factor STE2 GPCR [Penicillium alfredii]